MWKRVVRGNQNWTFWVKCLKFADEIILCKSNTARHLEHTILTVKYSSVTETKASSTKYYIWKKVHPTFQFVICKENVKYCIIFIPPHVCVPPGIGSWHKIAFVCI